ncbi:ATP-binding cassette domain-containing protein [Bifidobacterium adolescentis]|uniref:ATP-binding cassette domain-containing protein n=1 Tax=Bifidobacterium adolescentis TaxID=1680 RepID=A0A6I0VB52_BIFAD|nr:ATP-binding cassette domain-containing protein [Bifidobacterium adolescentis]KAB5970488.1 ATP-binding cassette domain-containing protein [Bifidobacterium adolescentis]KAB5972726.1 ATP-binding cassette domain-containing protein [Bifidobacterium adolescentis]KAB5974101.1 ATP-binding cassette domain-containing protein [Bifidobacterium adolescentis]KAB5975585.1 ATP-binding cassette domain-containing protein [Bifidobacterium adolescentis]
MFDKRLFSLADGVGRLIAAKVACQWLGLVANIAFVVAVVRMLQPLFAPVPSATAPCIAIILIAAVVRFVTIRAAARFGSEAAERVKLALREKLFNKMLALGPSYAQRVRTAGVVQSAGEGIEQIQSFFELFLPQLCYAVLAPITLFAVLAPIDLPTAATLLACAPLIVLIVGMVAMRAARVFKKYWGKYTDMGASFLDNLQGLETLKTFDADERAAHIMDEKAEQFRVMTMNVLQIQLRSLTAMDAVAYGGAAAGIGVAVWRFVSGSLSPSGVFALSGVLPLGLTPIAAVLLTILLAADFFIPLRQLGSYFHVAMNGMTSTKRIFALLDAPEPEHGSKELPEFGASGRGVGVEFRGVSYRYADVDVDAGGAAGAEPGAAGSAGAGVASPRRISSTSHSDVHSDMRNADVDSVDEGGGAGDARETRYALRNVAFRALPGEVTAIVGPSGSGKSTAVQLLAGTLAGYEGDVLLSEMPSGMQDEVLGAMLSSAAPDDSETLKSHQIRDLTAASLTREISIVSAHSHLFAGTLRDNLLMARADATDNELWQTLEAAHIDDFVRAQSRGLDMPITQDGANLSGGQKQRIAIARVLLRRSAVYIFDEATSSVDADSETLILQTIRALADAGATVLMVTHRMANAADADHVVVFDGGVVVEQGAHDDLMAADGTYAKLFRAQESVERVGLSGRVAPRVSRMTHASGAFAVSRMSGSAESNASGAKSDMPTTQVIARLLCEVGPLRKPMAFACACGILGHLAATFLPVFGVAALFAAAGAKVWNLSLPAAIAAMIICALIRGGMRYAEQYMNHNVAFRLLALFRSKTFAALRRLAPAKLSGKGKGDLIALVTTDVELLEIFFAHTISPVVIAIATTVLYTVALLTLSPAIAVTLVIAHLTVGIVLPKLFATAVGGLGGDIRRESAQLDDEMLDDMRGLDEIIRFDQGHARLAGIASRTRSLWSRRARLSAKNGDFAGFGAVLVVLFAAIAALLAMVTSGTTMPIASAAAATIQTVLSAPAARLTAAFVLLASSFGPTLALSALPANLTQTFAAARRLFALMDETPAVEERGDFLPRYHGMSMHDVTFGYGNSSEVPTSGSDADASESSAEPILNHVSLDVPQHGILGVQGPSGRGKSTLLKLLMRYWDPQSGLVALSEVPLPQIDAHHRRRVQTMMGQETYLFDGTIRENLLMACDMGGADTAGNADNAGDPDDSATSGRALLTPPAPPVSWNAADSVLSTRTPPSVGDDVLRAALAKASALELVDSLPQGLDTPVGELGGRLSEGERQRIGLARVFLRNASLVLFDEPTSRLDAYNESVILQSIDALAQQGSAVLLVSHRDSTMRIADRIVRM